MGNQLGDAPRIGTTRRGDGHEAWFIEFDHNGARVRRYYADRAAAVRALEIHKQLGVDPEGMMPPQGTT